MMRRHPFRQLAASRSGNFGLMTAMIIAVLVAMTGLAMNLYLGLARKDQLQQVADVAVLAAAGAKETTADALRIYADRVFEAQADSDLGGVAGITDFQYSPDRRITLTAAVEVPVWMGGGLLPSSYQVSVLSEAQQGQGSKIEVAMVLDTTASMAGKKMTDLKAAANAMLDVFEDSDTAEQEAKFSLVVFANDVNLGKDNYANEKWLSIPAPWTNTQKNCYRPVIKKNGCRWETCTGSSDGMPYTYQCEKCQSYEYGPETCTTTSTTYTYQGCVGSRQYPNDTLDNFASFNRPVPGVHDQCDGNIPALIPLTEDLTRVRTGINAMKPWGDTYISPGILWGWYTLSPQVPFAEGAPYGENVRKNIVIMTDGVNSRSSADPNATWGTHHWGGDTVKANENLTTTCNNAKRDGIQVYTVAVGIANTETEQRLAACASNPSMHFSMENSDQLVAAFEEIARQMTSPRLVR